MSLLSWRHSLHCIVIVVAQVKYNNIRLRANDEITPSSLYGIKPMSCFALTWGYQKTFYNYCLQRFLLAARRHKGVAHESGTKRTFQVPMSGKYITSGFSMVSFGCQKNRWGRDIRASDSRQEQERMVHETTIFVRHHLWTVPYNKLLISAIS